MPLNLNSYFHTLPGIYIISATKSKQRPTDYKIGLSVDLKSRLHSYSICFPRGFYIHTIISLPRPQGRWRDRNIDRAVRILEQTIFKTLTTGGIKRLKHAVMKTEWFHGTFKKIFDLVMEGVVRSGLNKHAVIHDNLSNVRYGTNTDRSPAQAGRKNPKTLNSVFPRKRLADLEGAMTLLRMRNEWDAIIPSSQESQHSEYTVE